MDSKVPQRRFLGKTENFKDNQERHFYQRMLKAYLKGKQVFNFGFKTVKNEFGAEIRVPSQYVVKCSGMPTDEQVNSQYERSLNNVSGKSFFSYRQSKKEIKAIIKERG